MNPRGACNGPSFRFTIRLLYGVGMGRRLLVFSAVLAMLTCVYLARSSYALHGIKTATYSPDRMYGAIVDGRAIVRKRWRLGRPTEQRDTTLSIVRAENPYTERPSTGPNP